MSKTLNIGERFVLVFKAEKKCKDDIDTILIANKFLWIHAPVVFDGFIEYRVNVNLRKAELVRQLLYAYKLYE